MIREPVVAGQFYPADPAALLREIQSYFPAPEPSLSAKALVVPHAGYMYSGPVAGAVYHAVRPAARVIVLGPNHTGRGLPLSLSPDGEWRTPLGVVAVDSDLNERLKKECPDLRQDRSAHAREHSLEVQLPFLQVLAPGFRFSGICVGTADYSALESLGHALARVVRSAKDPILMVCSSDMNHYESAEIASRKDRMAIEKMQQIDPPGLYRVVIDEDISMCGFAPAVSVLTACRDLGASAGHLIRYANSGDVSGDYESVVGYAGLAIV
jgi:hypothetical protein